MMELERQENGTEETADVLELCGMKASDKRVFFVLSGERSRRDECPRPVPMATDAGFMVQTLCVI